ncbi:MAG: signal peptidase I [Allosphingosinicella sp.]
MAEEFPEEERRSLAARVGVSLLNLLAPGTGLIRVGRSRAGFAFLLGPFFLFLLYAAAALLLPVMTPAGWIGFLALLVPLGLFLLIGPVVATWRSSRFKARRRAWWRRWYVLLGLILAYQFGSVAAVDMLHGIYKPFYIPAESMEPTLAVGDRLVADMRDGGALKPGEIVLLNVRGAVYVKRVAAMAGDRIEMVGGVPYVNGVPAARRETGETTTSTAYRHAPARVFIERLPGEEGEHRVLDTGPTIVDDMAETTVPPGHIFVLGDNRDHSADSRVAPEQQGVGMARVDDVVGRPLFKTWAGDWRWLGTPLR